MRWRGGEVRSAARLRNSTSNRLEVPARHISHRYDGYPHSEGGNGFGGKEPVGGCEPRELNYQLVLANVLAASSFHSLVLVGRFYSRTRLEGGLNETVCALRSFTSS